MRSKGSALFSTRCGDRAAMAARLGVSQSTISLWRSGQRKPTEAKRIEIEAVTGVPAGAWEEQAETTERAPATTTGEITSLGGARDETLRLATQLRDVGQRLLEDAGDPSFDPRERAGIVRAAAPTVQALSKLCGSMLEITEAQLIKAPAMALVLERIAIALAAYPDAARAVADALEGIGE